MENQVIAPVGGRSVVANSRYMRLYNNPHFDYLSEMLPKNIKDMFKWCEVVYHSMPAVTNAIRKIVNYPVTEFSFSDIPPHVKKTTQEMLESIGMKNALLDFNMDYFIYGNSFRTVYKPFKRFLVCKTCGSKVAIDNAKFEIRQKKIFLTCEGGHKAEATIEDIDTYDVTKIQLVRWDPKSIELSQNPITGKTKYYYKVPPEFAKKVQKGDKQLFSDTPKVFIDASLAGKNVEFGENFFHAKMPSLAGFQSGWGISPLMSTLRIYMYIAVLRKASEAIGMEHITPQRILFPQSSGSSDPALMSSMERWRKEISNAVERWRMDPNYIMLAPYPTGITNIGSQGRQLTPTEEIKDARNEMALALDIPPQLVMGDMNLQNSAVALRLMENQMLPHVANMERFISWVVDKVNIYLDKEYVAPKMVPFRLADDMMNKQILLQLQQAGTVSKATLQEAFNLRPEKEKNLIHHESVDSAIEQQKIQKEIEDKQNNVQEQVQQQVEEEQTGMPSQYNQQKMIAQAQQMAQQFLQVPYEERRSQLAQLQNEDYVMWALVSKQLDVMRDQAQQGGGEQ